MSPKRPRRPMTPPSQFTVDKAYAPSFVLNCLTATVASVVDKKLVMEHVAAVTPTAEYKYDNDFGNDWLKTGYAGSGPSSCANGAPTKSSCMERNDNYYGEKAKLARVIYRHMKESSGAAPGAGGRRHRRRAQPRAGRSRRGLQERRPRPPPARRRARSIISASTRRTRIWPSRRCARPSNIWSTMTRSARP